MLAKVGEGAMGEVFRAEDLDLGRIVAIKIVKLGQFAGDVVQPVIQRFLQEARAAAAITHPCVPIIYRVGVESGWPYIVMEWIDGTTLEAQLDGNRRFTVEQASRICRQILAALESAHDAGIVHRDIKPGNLMLTPEGRIKVTDFGIARVQGTTVLARTQAGLILGTPWYAAPEQLAGLPIDHRADIYGVGCVLYEAVTGHAPYEANTIYELLAVVQAGAPPLPSATAAGIPPAFDAIVQRALAKDPADRFATARDMAQALEPLATSGTTRRPPATGRGAAPTVQRVPTVVVDATTVPAIVTATLRGWPSTPLGSQATSGLLARLVERPLHAPAFCGAAQLGDAWLLVGDGLIYAAFDPATGRSGDRVLESLPDPVDATLRAAPDRLDPEIVPLLASLLLGPRAQQTALDASLMDLRGLADKLAANGFSGSLRLARGPALGFAMFRKGHRVLDVFGAGWPQSAEARPWEDWIAESAALASVDDLRVAFPAITFRQQLRELALEVVRPEVSASSSLRFDTADQAEAIELRPRDESRARLRRGETALQTLMTADPAHSLARWILTELPRQFDQYGRSARWKALVAPIETVADVRLHHTLAPVPEAFDVATYDGAGRIHHVIDRIALGTADAVDQFVRRADAAKRAGPTLGGAILVAPRFEEDALAAYVRALRGERRSLIGRLDGFRHREGFRRLDRAGYHLLLVEDEGGKRRPLVPE